MTLRANDSVLYLAALLQDAGLPQNAALDVAQTAHDAGEHDDDGGFHTQRASLEKSEVAYLRKAKEAGEHAAALRIVILEHYAPVGDDDNIPW